MSTKRFTELLNIINESEEEFNKFYEKGNNAAGTRIRKAMLELKNLGQEIRTEIQSIKNKG